VLALAWLWPVPARLTSRIPHDLGDPLLNTWILWWNTQAVPFTERWWNAPFFYPAPGALALSEHLFGIAVFTTPLQFAGLNPIGAYNVALILSAWLSGFFAFLLGRRLTGSTAAGVIAGLAFGFSPYRVSQLAHLQVLTAQWMPLALYAMHAYLDDRRRRWLALFAVAWLLQALSNGYFLLFFPVLIALWLAWFVRWKADPRPGVVLLATLAGASLLLLPTLLEYREVHDAMGLARQRGEMLLFSAEPGSLLRMPDLLKFWPYFEPKTQEDFLFPGVTAVMLVLAAALLAAPRLRTSNVLARRSPLFFYSVTTLVMWWLALGPAPEDQPLQALVKPYTWLTMLPGFHGLRAPSRFAMLATLSLSVAAALAFARLAPARPRLRGALVAIAALGLLVDGYPERIPLHAAPGRIALPDVRDALVLELPIDEPAAGTAAMHRAIEHGRPLLSGYSGHYPPHLRIFASALDRDDPSSLLFFAAGRPVIITVNHRYDPYGWSLRFIRSLPGIVEHGGSAAGSVFVLPAQPRARAGKVGAPLPIAAIKEEAREHAVIDLGQSQFVREVSFPVRWHFDKMAPRIEVETSNDGVIWQSVWLGWTGGPAIAGALEDPREAPFRIPLPDVRTRYLRIHPAPRWMVSELTVY
jgi:hypothetical protein